MQLYTKILIGMAVGILLGFFVGPNSTLLPQDSVKLSSSAEIKTEMGGVENVKLLKEIPTAEILGTETRAGVDADGEEIEEVWLNVRGTLTSRDILRLKKTGVIPPPDPDAEQDDEDAGPAAGDQLEDVGVEHARALGRLHG